MPKFLLLTFLLSSLPLLADPGFEVRSADGRKVVIELLALEGDQVVFSTVSDNKKEHTLALDKFDENSQSEILEKAKNLRPRLPKMEFNVVIGKRRVKDGYYMVNQTVDAKVKMQNFSLKIPFPKSKAYFAYIGRDREHPDQYKLMGKRDFDVDVAANQVIERELLGVKTRYDSDNKGKGNIGGYQYEGYLLVVMDEAGVVLFTKTSDAAIAKALERDPETAKRITGFDDNTLLDGNLEELDPSEAL